MEAQAEVAAVPAVRSLFPATTAKEDDDDGLTFRQRYEKELLAFKQKYVTLEPEFEGDDMNETLTEEDKKRGWKYPLTKTQQKKEFGCVVADQQRFLWRLQDGHLDVVEDYLLDPAKKRAIDVNLYDDYGWTPLHYAAQLNLSDIVKALMDGDADPNLRDKVCGMTALEMAQAGAGDDSGPSDDVIEVLKDFGVRA
eukprot:CAMPEP_0179232240 /NCGR_PEP_ID=MMETSP0797-20121207/11758_1 /TAXON_ID=47934 /ORGANISM="Dinophysis acuminata, Strain DAEP01" /LENGTH=195 /DNA_ID=CAMNT_0020939355 /DNA_START=77 /DNA_END=664 /DNA_ORIENTATION=-